MRFAAVGFAGVFVNMFCFWLAYEYLFEEQAALYRDVNAALFGIVVSIFTNFLLNDRWTWGDRKKGRAVLWFWRLAKYYAVAGVGASLQLITLVVLLTLALDERAFWEVVFANLVGIGFATISNYLLMHFWSFRNASAKSD